MTDTYTNDPGELPGLTLEALLKAKQELEALLPELLYRTHEYAPRVNAKGEPAIMVLPEVSYDDWPPTPTGRHIAIVHPDNPPHLQRMAQGHYRLVEWKP